METGRHNDVSVVWFFLKQYPALYATILFLTIGYSVLESLNISMLLPLLNSILRQETPQWRLFTYLDKLIALLPFDDRFVAVCVLAIAILAVKEAFAFGRIVTVGYSVGTVVCDVKEQVFRKYANSDYSFFLANKQGDLAYKALLSPGRLGNCLQYIPDLVAALLMTITIGFLLVSISFTVTACLAIAALSFNTLTKHLARKVSYHIGAERARVSSEANVSLNEFLDGIRQIKASSAVGHWLNEFTNSVRGFKALVIRDAIWLAVPERLMQSLPPMMLIGILVVLYIYSGGTSRDLLVSNLAVTGVYVFGFYRLLPHITSFGRLRMQILGLLPDMELLYDLLNLKTTDVRDGDVALNGFRAEIRFENVSFGYRGEHVLKNISFTIEKGKTTAIVGRSGAGKSTLVNLLMRLFEPDEGKIWIDGIDIKTIDYSCLIRMIGLVSQETFIFNGSVRGNILFGLNGVSSERLQEVAKLANADQFISLLPDGYETLVGDKGLKLSGGQRQRIAIARAMLRNPEILVLDEATSSLDHDSELQVQQAINMVSKGRTVVVIAHRLSTVITADKIVVLDQREIVGQGTHRELMEMNGVYRSLYVNQVEMLRQIETGPMQ